MIELDRTSAPLGSALLPSDGYFHQPQFNDRTWLETNWFSFLVPEANLRAHIYNGFRTNLGVTYSAVCIWSRDCDSVLDFDHYDAQVHLPLPAGNLDGYRLENGLVVEADPLHRYSIRYDGFNGTRFELELTAVMPAIESRETTVAGGADFSHFHEVRPDLRSATGHIDQTLRVEGWLEMGGRRHQVDHLSNRDHSWGSRPERNHGQGYFDEAYIGDTVVHVQTQSDATNRGVLTNGYMLEHGELIRLVEGTGRYERDGWRTTHLDYELTDERGRSHHLVGTPVASAPLPTWPNQYNIAGLTRWELDGQPGWGEYKWHWEVSAMIAAARPAIA